tara:strand:- start:457 stop:1095 length:639 start_codon:yes stop_codon:yes gene_type:complete
MSKTTEKATAGHNSGTGTINEPTFQLLCKAFWLQKARAHNAGKIVSEWVNGFPDDEECRELLSAPPDWEDALDQEGFDYSENAGAWVESAYVGTLDDDCDTASINDCTHTYEEDPEEAFRDLGLDATDYEQEVFEHWIVDEWFADRLEMQGEHCPEWQGLRIWCRTCTDQAVYVDDCVRCSMLGLITDGKAGKVSPGKLLRWSQILGVGVTL